MTEQAADVGLAGLAVMGKNLALNMASKGYSVRVFNRTPETTRKFMDQAKDLHNITASFDLEDFCAGLRQPRSIFLMVKAGDPVDDIIEQIIPHLAPGDLVMDGGNSRFTDTQRRFDFLTDKRFLFLGVGISGGELGALHGPSIMPGGSKKAYDRIGPVLKSIAAQADGVPCVAYMGSGGAGHFVKMVHNAIEYADMEIISEAYDLMRRGWNFSLPRIREVFIRFNNGALNSYLMEITTDILAKKDPETGGYLLESILDRAGHKNTGKWAVESAMDMGAFIPAINAALEARIVSGYLGLRIEASRILSGPAATIEKADENSIENLEKGLFFARLWAHAEGFDLMEKASAAHNWSLNPEKIAGVWKNGCIIRSSLLSFIQKAFSRKVWPDHLLLSPVFADSRDAGSGALRSVVASAVTAGIGVPVLSAALGGYDLLRCKRLPANLIQAQRDYFGAHTYERIDKPGIFHTDWT